MAGHIFVTGFRSTDRGKPFNNQARRSCFILEYSIIVIAAASE